MKKNKRENLEAAGWRVGEAADFLKLTKEEAAFVDMKIALADSLKRRRLARKLTHAELADSIGSSQSNISRTSNGSAPRGRSSWTGST